MADTTLVRHWMGWSEEEIMRSWRDGHGGYDEEVVRMQNRLQDGILDGIAKRASDGDITAFEWLDDRGLISSEGRTSQMQIILQAIANRARKGDMDAIEWLQSKGRIELPSKTTD